MSEYLNTLFSHSTTPNLKNPEYIGPGIWWTLHTLAADATTQEKIAFFMNYVETLKSKFPCNECRNHFITFCEANNPNISKNKEKGLFKWSWECHNNANIITKKPQMLYSDAEKLYYSNDFCSLDCGKPKIISPYSGIIIKKSM